MATTGYVGLPQLPTNTDPKIEPDLREIFFAIHNLQTQVDSGGGGGGGGIAYVTGFFPGVSSTVAAGMRMYAGIAGNITLIQVWASLVVTVATTLEIYKNGALLTTLVIPLGASEVTSAVLALPILTTDYLTAGISGSGTSNAGFRIEITPT